MHVQVRINRKVKMKSTKTQCYVAEKKFRERYPKIQLRSSSQRSTQLPFESGTSRAISTVAILLCLSFLVSLVLQYWSVRSSKRKGLQETKQIATKINLCVGVCVGGVSAPLNLNCSLTTHHYIGSIYISLSLWLIGPNPTAPPYCHFFLLFL